MKDFMIKFLGGYTTQQVSVIVDGVVTEVMNNKPTVVHGFNHHKMVK